MPDCTYTTRCMAKGCNAVHVETISVPWDRAFPLPRPTYPPDWFLIGEFAYCPDHDVVLTVDGDPETYGSRLRTGRSA